MLRLILVAFGSGEGETEGCAEIDPGEKRGEEGGKGVVCVWLVQRDSSE